MVIVDGLDQPYCLPYWLQPTIFIIVNKYWSSTGNTNHIHDWLLFVDAIHDWLLVDNLRMVNSGELMVNSAQRLLGLGWTEFNRFSKNEWVNIPGF